MSESMLKVQLPDGSLKELPSGSSAADLAASIGAGLARAAVAATVNGELWDLNRPLPDEASVAIVTRSDEAPRCLEDHSPSESPNRMRCPPSRIVGC